jgi:hypothetical protein
VNEEAHSGQFNVDIIKLFKPVSTDLDQTIFEVDSLGDVEEASNKSNFQ